MADEGRMQRLREARKARQEAIYSRPCPMCGALVGEKCLTSKGKRTAQHAERRRGANE